jgi:hypothetical protein
LILAPSLRVRIRQETFIAGSRSFEISYRPSAKSAGANSLFA